MNELILPLVTVQFTTGAQVSHVRRPAGETLAYQGWTMLLRIIINWNHRFSRWENNILTLRIKILTLRIQILTLRIAGVSLRLRPIAAKSMVTTQPCFSMLNSGLFCHFATILPQRNQLCISKFWYPWHCCNKKQKKYPNLVFACY